MNTYYFQCCNKPLQSDTITLSVTWRYFCIYIVAHVDSLMFLVYIVVGQHLLVIERTPRHKSPLAADVTTNT